MSRFFIDRPIFAWVIAIAIMLAGGLCIVLMPINQYPDVAPVQIIVSATYPGASAQTVEDTVIKPIEQKLTGLDHLRYITAQSTNNGSAQIILTFDQSTNSDIAEVQTQIKTSLAQAQLPSQVTSQGLTLDKYQINFFEVATLNSKDGKLSSSQLGDMLVSRLQDPIARTKGVGMYLTLGAEGALRVWMDPTKLRKFGLMPSDVANAINAQNIQLSAGQLGGTPTIPGTVTNAAIQSKTRFTQPSQFNNVLLKVNPDGSKVRVKDIGTVAFGSSDYSISGTYNGKPAVGIALRLAPGGNVIDAVKAVQQTIKNNQSVLPEGVEVHYPYETSTVTKDSILEVTKTLIEAIVLVFLIMYLFLQNFRATLVPSLVVPVVLLGSFGILHIFGFTINILTMFGMVLAIGLLVDDAIVVVENVERLIHEEGLTPLEASRKSMDEISGALVGIGIVITAVMLPMSFMTGSTGVIYRQFSVAIVSSMILSVIMALIFTPALCATLLKEKKGSLEDKKGFFGWFNRLVDKNTHRYIGLIKSILKRRFIFGIFYLIVVGAVAYLFSTQSTTFLPDEDQGQLMVEIVGPANMSSQRTQAVINDVMNYFHGPQSASVDSMFAANGFSLMGRGQNTAMGFVKLKDWGDRPKSAATIANETMQHFAHYKNAKIIAIVPPAIMQLGNSSGFDFYLTDPHNRGVGQLMKAAHKVLAMANKDPRISHPYINGLDDVPRYNIDINDERLMAAHVSESAVNSTLQAAWGGSYIGLFTYENRAKQVYIQGRASSRVTPQDLNKWYVRSEDGHMVPFSAFASGHWSNSSPELNDFNEAEAIEIQGSPGAGYSSSDATNAIKEIVGKLPGYQIQWYNLSYEEQAAGEQAPILYAISFIVVFLALAALYESWSIPISILLVIPFGILGSLIAMGLRGLSGDVFFNVGLLVVVGLAAKNAILIVEFAKEIHEKQGKSLVEAALHAAQLRLRPIIMTSLAFIIGVLPLWFASGAGAGSSHSIGTGVIGGMVFATTFSIFFVPLFYVVVMNWFNRGKSSKEETQSVDPVSGGHNNE